jgi:hypothetical protein
MFASPAEIPIVPDRFRAGILDSAAGILAAAQDIV